MAACVVGWAGQVRGNVKGWVGGCGKVCFELLLVEALRSGVCEEESGSVVISIQILTRRLNSQVDHHIWVNVSLNPSIAVLHHLVPHAAVATLGHQLLPPRAPKRVLALFGT